MIKKKVLAVLSMLLLLSGCNFPGLGRGVGDSGIVIAGGSTSERQILAEIVAQMISHYLPQTDTTLINNLGSTMLILQSLQRKDTNASSGMYTGTSMTGELNLPVTTDPDEAMKAVVQGYSNKFNMIWFPSYGFDNTYAFMVRRDLAEKYNLEKVSDLAPYASELTAGVDTGWIDRQGDGYEDFKKLYQFDFKQVYPMEIGLVYNAVYNKKMDIVLGYSTDGRIDSYDLVLLEDDLHLFPPYDTSPVVTKELLREHPEIETILLKLENEISNTTMQKMNRLSDEDHWEPYTIAQNFLKENNYFESKEVVPLKNRELYQDLIRDILSLTEKE